MGNSVVAGLLGEVTFEVRCTSRYRSEILNLGGPCNAPAILFNG